MSALTPALLTQVGHLARPRSANKETANEGSGMFEWRTILFRVTVSVSGNDLQPVQTAVGVTRDEATVQQGGKVPDPAFDFEPRDLAPCGYVPQPDRVVP